MRRQIGIIADDLTGANDSGVQLTKKGINTSVLFDIPESYQEFTEGLVIDTDSRAMTVENAVAVTRDAGVFLKEEGFEVIYKKMDSTLRGHIGAELKALADVFQPEFIVVAPAFPAMGRTTKDGNHYIHNVKISDTETAEDPKHPVKNAFIPGVIEEDIGEKVGLLRQADIHTDAGAFREKVERFRDDSVEYIVFDAGTEDDLQEAALKMSGISDDVIWAGSAGLAEVLPEVLDLAGDSVEVFDSAAVDVMTVCGSLSQVTQEQVRFAAGKENITAVELDPVKFLSDEAEEYKTLTVQRCLDGFAEGNDAVLYVPSNTELREQVQRVGNDLNLTSYEIGAVISKAIGEIVKATAEGNPDLNGFVLTGGDTAKDTSFHLGGIGFELVEELETGIPMGRLIGTEREYMVVTKAGAFGREDSIYQSMMALKGEGKHGK